MNATVLVTIQYGLSSDGSANRAKRNPAAITATLTASERPTAPEGSNPLTLPRPATAAASADPAARERVLAAAREEQQRDDRQHERGHIAEVGDRVDRRGEVVDDADHDRRDERHDQRAQARDQRGRDGEDDEEREAVGGERV